MTDIGQILARNEERLERIAEAGRKTSGRVSGRVMQRGLVARRRLDALVARLFRMVSGALLVLVVALLWGIFHPLGFGGVVLTTLAMLAIAIVLALYPKDSVFSVSPLPKDMEKEDLAALPARISRWIGRNRHLMPPAAQPAIATLAKNLDTLAPELRALAPDNPAHGAAQRLLGTHLPRLLESYFAVPERLRDSPDATAHLIDGLDVVEAELGRLAHTLGRKELDDLEVEGRFLEKRYSEGGAAEGTAPPR